MVKSDAVDENNFSPLLKIHFDSGIVLFQGHRAKPVHFFTVWLGMIGSRCTLMEGPHIPQI
jgi:hypothetical protein